MADKPNQTIFVIDDDEDIVKTIKGNLELDGYTVLLKCFPGNSYGNKFGGTPDLQT